ncbi:hypothetical protein IMZ48_45830 [Candidatus Bathyarchaeota archaeon]|nr:hypothetical protein [Candidatus Bathyarchaeota archaeon]
MANSRQIKDISDSNVEGEPALAAQAAFATSYAQRAFAYSVVSQEMTLSLERLAQMVREGRNRSGSREPDVNLLDPGSNINDMTMPPLELTISCIQKLRSKCPNHQLCGRARLTPRLQTRSRSCSSGHGILTTLVNSSSIRRRCIRASPR